MNVKRFIPVLFMAGLLTMSMISCKSKISDADLKTKVETAVSGNPDVLVDVKDGVVTLSGTVATEQEKISLETAAKSAEKGVKSVVNNIIVEAAPVLPTPVDDTLVKNVADVMKDFPALSANVKDGVIQVTGTIEQARIKTLKQALDNLNPKKVDLSGLSVK
ncbi:BON domain-containing protein [Sphingobacterium spiritivorum]|uniref:BON domain-containing protein n=1 Tax=Sphingobacterium spiritivorum TaxID=258 RepID=UPI001917F7FB|nr:BON domain-containing protein [Sphingobacterium spiritivorum]QQT26225.1 BON domain-containing protein [Sphingobacterium spiritivorum]